jgi:hypothetical protein
MLTGNDSPQGVVGIQIGGSNVYMREPPTFFEHLGEQKGITKALVREIEATLLFFCVECKLRVVTPQGYKPDFAL